MAAIDHDEPLDPAAERLRRKLTRLLMVSGAIMMLGLIAVFAALVYRLGGSGDAPRQVAAETMREGPADARLAIPAGSRLVATELDGARALLTLQADDGAATLILVELATGAIVGRYALTPE